jgi:hypothetical protein
MYENTEGRWSGDESVLAAIWETILMQRNSDIMGKMCLSVQEYGRFSLEQLVSILSGDICFCCCFHWKCTAQVHVKMIAPYFYSLMELLKVLHY